jgi:hypothetical protein
MCADDSLHGRLVQMQVPGNPAYPRTDPRANAVPQLHTVYTDACANPVSHLRTVRTHEDTYSPPDLCTDSISYSAPDVCTDANPEPSANQVPERRGVWQVPDMPKGTVCAKALPGGLGPGSKDVQVCPRRSAYSDV